ncbi:MAG: DinB family protein [Planctomycetota bacterium]|jgi:uncharacterized damage-inducible protein DinB
MPKDELEVIPIKGYPKLIGSRLWTLQDCRTRTKNCLKDLPREAVDFVEESSGKSIGSLLYHIAAIEVDWLYADVLCRDWPPDFEDLFPVDVRDKTGKLSLFTGETVEQHLERLDRVREHLLSGYKEISIDDFFAKKDLPDYGVSPSWVLHHLAQHESHHRGEIALLRRIAAHP